MTSTAAPGRGAIELTDVAVAFRSRSGGRHPALDGVDLAIPGGGVVALIGRSLTLHRPTPFGHHSPAAGSQEQ